MSDHEERDLEDSQVFGLDEMKELMKEACREALIEFFRGGAQEEYYDMDLSDVCDLVAECDNLDDLGKIRKLEINHPYQAGGRAAVFEVIRLREQELR